MITKIIISLLVAGTGLVMLIYTRQVVDFTGANSWVENFIGRGQTYTFTKILGAIFIFLAFVYLLGDLDWLIKWNN